MRQLTALCVNAPDLLRKSIKEGMTQLEGVFIKKFVKQMKSMLNQNGTSINHKW